MTKPMMLDVDRAALEIAMEKIRAEFGPESIGWGASEVDRLPRPCTERVDHELFERLLGDDGWPVRGVITLTGREGEGKSVMVNAMIALAQSTHGACILVDTDRRFDAEFAALLGVDPRALVVVRLDCRDRVTRALRILLEANAMSLIAIDSLPQVVMPSELKPLPPLGFGPPTSAHVRERHTMLEELDRLCQHHGVGCLLTETLRQPMPEALGGVSIRPLPDRVGAYVGPRLRIRSMARFPELTFELTHRSDPGRSAIVRLGTYVEEVREREIAAHPMLGASTGYLRDQAVAAVQALDRCRCHGRCRCWRPTAADLRRARDNWQLHVDRAHDVSAFAIELSVLTDDELPGLIEFLQRGSALPFRRVSVHAPSGRLGGVEQHRVALLRELPQWVDAIVVHPSTIEDADLYRLLGRRLLIENLDRHGRMGRTAAELSEIFGQLPDAGLCLDLAHAMSVDPEMDVARAIVDTHGERLQQLHLSSPMAWGDHTPMSDAEIQRFLPLLDRCRHVPWILEAPLDAEHGLAGMDVLRRSK